MNNLKQFAYLNPSQSAFLVTDKDGCQELFLKAVDAIDRLCELPGSTMTELNNREAYEAVRPYIGE